MEAFCHDLIVSQGYALAILSRYCIAAQACHHFIYCNRGEEHYKCNFLGLLVQNVGFRKQSLEMVLGICFKAIRNGSDNPLICNFVWPLPAAPGSAASRASDCERSGFMLMPAFPNLVV